MKQKAQQQLTKKNFILYKSRTGWKVKARLFGGLVVAISAATIAGWTTPVTAQAATAPTNEQVAPQSAAPVSQSPAAPTPAGHNTSNQDPTQAAPANSSATQPAPLLASTPQPETATTTEPDTTPAETPTADTTKTYPVLTPDKDVNVGVDQSQVSLTADQIASHFTAKVENRNGSDQDANPTKNTTTQTINKDGTVALTSNDVHTYYNAYGGTTSVQGHQSAHVSFEHEIDFSHNFSMSGALGIGTRTSGGADSVGFIFAPGDPAKATQGGSGGNLGIGGLANAFGFVYDEYANVNDYNDPTDASGIWHTYVGWRTTDANGRLQRPADTDWEAASQVGLNDRQVNPLNEFTMDYDATHQQLTVLLGSGKFTRHIADISTGYSISVAASTGGSWNDYSARIDKFSYTPKTIPLTVKLVDSADNDAPLDKTAVTAVANIGDTISVFSTQAAAARAVAAGEVDPSLVTVLPTDSAGNVYVVDGTQRTTSTGTAHAIDGDSTIADGTYYTYTVTDGDDQTMTVPVRLAYQVVVTPVDSKTGQPIAGLQPQTVTTVAGKPVIVQIPGYTPTKVVLATPTDGEKTAYANLPIDQTTTQPATTTTTDTAAPITHYYQGSGTTVDGQAVSFTKTAGTGQTIAGETVQQTPKDDTTTTNTYYWSTVGTAVATDSTDETNPQTVATILVPDQATLTYWDQQAIKNQTSADEYKAEAQKMHDEFVAISGLTPDQISSADDLLKTVADIYTNVSTSNGAAKQAFEGAMTATTANEIYTGGQDGYAALRKAQNLLIEFKADLQQLTTTNQDAQNMLASLPSWSETYNQPERTGHVAALGEGFGTGITADQIAQLNTYFTYYSVQQETSVVTPKDVGTYKVTLSDAGRDYLKSLAPGQANAGLFVPGLLTIKAQATTATVNAAQVTYGQMPDATTWGGTAAEHPFQAGWLEIWDVTDQKIVTAAAGLQVAHQYVLRYSAAAQATLEQDKNYNWNFGEATLTVDPLAVMVTAQDHGKTYGTTADPTLDLTSDSVNVLKNGDSLSDLKVQLVRDAGETAGTYDIRLKSFNNSNYQVTLDNRGKFTIVAKPLTLIADNSTKVYGEADPELTFHLDPNKPDNSLVGQDTADALNVTLTRAKTADSKDSENVGTYAITLAPDDPNNPRNPNYAITLTPGTLTIKKRPIEVTVANATKTYGAVADPQFSVAEVKLASGFTGKTTNALVGDDTLEAEFSRDEGETAHQTYAIHLVGIKNSNYQVSSINGTLTINPRPVTVTINNAQKVYGEVDPAWTWTATDTSTSGETLSKLDPNDLDLEFTRKAGETVGTYQIATKSKANPNYDVTVTSGNLKITPRPIVVTVANATKTYGATTDPQFSVAEVKLASSFTGKTTNALVGNDTLGAEFSRDEGETAHQTYGIHLDGIGNPNYRVLSSTDGTLTINPRPVTVTVNDAQKVYGEVDPAWTWTATDTSTSGETLSKLDPDDFVLRVAREAGETFGTYRITPELKDNPNYDVTVTPGTLTISPRSLDLTIADESKTYGYADPQFSWSVVNTDKSELPIDRDSLHVVLTRDSGQTVGDAYRIRLASTRNDNYVINVVKEGQFTINKRAVTVAMQTVSKTYGETDPALGLTAAAQNQLVNGDQLSALGITLTRVKGENVGTYLLSGQSKSQNYAVSFDDTPVYLTIKKQAVTVAMQAVSKTYGETDPALGLTAAAQNQLVNGDQLSALGITLTRVKGENVGTYLISGQSKSQNYAVSFDKTPVYLTIDQRQVTVAMQAVSKTYGETDPTLGLTAAAQNQLVNGDQLSALGVTITRADGENVGTYLLSGQSNSQNYAVSFDKTPVYLTIDQRPVIVAMQAVSKTYGETDPALGLTAAAKTLLVNGDQLSALGVTITRADGENVGTYLLSGQSKSQNYAVSFDDTPVYLAITPRPITVTLANQTKTYGHADPQPQVIVPVTGLVTGDTLAALGLSLTRATGEDVGTYAITGQGTGSNYLVTVTPGQLQITPAVVSAVTLDTVVDYGGVPTPTGQARVDGKLVTLAPTDFEIVDDTQHVVPATALQVGHPYTVRLTAAAQARLGVGSPDYAVKMLRASYLVVKPRQLTLRVADQQKYAGDRNPQNTAKLVSGALKPGDTLADLHLQYVSPAAQYVGQYAIGVTSDNQNYELHVLPGRLTVVPQPTVTVDNPTVPTTVTSPVTVTKQWPDQSETIYTYDPATQVITVDQVAAGHTTTQKVTAPTATVTLRGKNGQVTVVDTTDPQRPQILHFQDRLTPTPSLATLKTWPKVQMAHATRTHGKPQRAARPQAQTVAAATARQTVASAQVADLRQASAVAANSQPRRVTATQPATGITGPQPAKATPTRVAATKLPQTGQRDGRGWSALGALLLALLAIPFVRRRSTH